MNIDKLIDRIDALIVMAKDVESSVWEQKVATTIYKRVDYGKLAGFRSASLSFIEHIYGCDHTHYREFNKSVDKNYLSNLNAGVSILDAIKDEISRGWLFTFKGLVTAEIFSDFLEMADYLLDKNYKDPAAVMAGSVLEEHLRQLCLKNKINIEENIKGAMRPKKADLLNADLAKKKVYNKLDQKAVTTWLDLRNKAAHGKYSEYSKEQVVNMLQSVNDIISRNPL